MLKPLDLGATVEVRSASDALLEAALPAARDHRHGDAAAAEKLLSETPDAARDNIWVASITGSPHMREGPASIGDPKM